MFPVYTWKLHARGKETKIIILNVSGVNGVLFFRTQMLGHSQQQRADLEDATFTVELQHKEVMDEMHRLYSESIASYQGAYEYRVSHRTRSLEPFHSDIQVS